MVVLGGGAVLATEEIGVTTPEGAGDATANAGRGPVSVKTMGAAVGLVADKQGRVAVAFADGAVALRERGVWTAVAVEEAPSAARPGSPPATSPQ